MPNIIQIKRSTSTAAPSTLNAGELAYTTAGDVLFIGDPASGPVIAIGGKRVPGTLTANQAIVVDSSKNIDTISVTGQVNTATFYATTSANVGTAFTANSSLVNAIALNVVNTSNTANLNVSDTAAFIKVKANSALGSAGQYLTANSTGGTYWSNPASGVAGSDTQVQFNDGGILSGSAGLTFNKTSNTLTTPYITVGKDLTVSGNLNVTGALVTINVSTIVVADPLIKLASNNTTTADNIDIGLYGLYTNTTAAYYTALYRDNSTKVWKLLDGVSSEPSTTVSGGSPAVLQAYLTSGGLVSNSSAINITANGSISSAIAANTLTLTTALGASSGGTGLSTYAAGDILYAGSTNPSSLSKLAVPGSAANGQVLQIVNNLPAYAALDGGSF